MANRLRIIQDNAADRATITASSTAGALVAANMQTDQKGQIHRSVGTSVTYTLQWQFGEGVAAVALPTCNLTATSTIRVRLYEDSAGTILLADSGVQYACPGPVLGDWDWTAPLNANAFIFGGYAKTAIWFDQVHFARRCVIDLIDRESPAGAIDCARVVAGAWWSPKYNAAHGYQVAVIDTSVQTRNDAGDLLADRGSQHETMVFTLPRLEERDRAQLTRILRYVGTAQNFLVSLYPGSGMSVSEQDHMIFGKRVNSPLSYDSFNVFSTKLEIEGW